MKKTRKKYIIRISMNLIKKALLILPALTLTLSLFAGCVKSEQSKGYEYTEFYSGPETIYPDNMPAASSDIPKRQKPTKGFITSSMFPTTLNDLIYDPSFAESIDSLYRVTVDRELPAKDASKLRGYVQTKGERNSFFEITIWYDYIREEQVCKKQIITQIGTKEFQSEHQGLLQLGESYVLLLARQFSDWDFTGLISYKCTFHILVSSGQEYFVQDSERLPIHEGYNKGYAEFKPFQIDDHRLNQAGFIAYDSKELVSEIQSLFILLVNENDEYIAPSYDEYKEYVRGNFENREKFTKEMK